MAYRYKGRALWKNPFDLAIYPLLLDQLLDGGEHRIGGRVGDAVVSADRVALWRRNEP